MKPRRIVQIPTMSWKTRIILFTSTFGVLWLFTEPLPAFGIGTNLLQCLGVWGYLTLLVLSAFFVFITEYYQKSRLIGKISFTKLKIILTQDGTQHIIEVPQDMLVRVFIDLFIKSISKNSDNPAIKRADMFETTLLVERPTNSNKFEELPKSKTIKEVGLKDNDTCKLYGRVLEPSILYSPEF